MTEKEDNVDLRLALGNSTQFVETRLKSNKGVGANAGSRINLAFAASDPLSELVWSPDNGLTWRCADSTLAATKPLLLWNVGPSNLVLSLPESIRTREDNDDKSSGEGHCVVAHVDSPVNQNLDKEYSLATFSQSKASASLNSGNQIESISEDKMDLTGDSNVMQHHSDIDGNILRNIAMSSGTAISDYNGVDQNNKNELTQPSSDCKVDLTSRTSPNMLHGSPSKVLSGVIVEIAGGSASSGNDFSRACEVQCRLQYEPVSPLQFVSPRQGAEEATLVTDQESERKVRCNNSLVAGAPSKKMESSAENVLSNLVRIEALEKADERLAWETSSPLKVSPTNSWMDLYQKKGKAKVLSDVDVSVRLSNDVEHSAESCESAGFSAKGKRRLNPSESVKDSKRAKTESEDEPAFISPIRHNSSFMSWISNMVKGYRDGPSLDLTLDHSDSQRESVQDVISLSKQSGDGCADAGFHSMFQSLYYPTSRKPDPPVSEADYFDEASEHLLLANRRSGNIPLLAYPNKEELRFEKNLMAKVNTDAATSGNLVLPSQLEIVPVNATPLREIHENNWLSYKDGSRFLGSLSKQSNSTPEKSSLNVLPESKTNNNKIGENSTPGSLWFTRFCAKPVNTFSKLFERNHNENRGDTDPSNFNYIQITSGVQSKRNTLGTRDKLDENEGDNNQDDLEALSENMEDYVAHREVPRHNRQNSFHKLDAILPVTICKSPDEIASIFARRLDALKHISLSDRGGGTSPQMATCLFCGKHGHELRNCQDTTNFELEALLRDASFQVKVEESCFCLICFQLDHWANTCPKKSTRRQNILDNYNSVSNLNVKLGEGDEQDSAILKKQEGVPLYAADLNSKQKKYFPLCNFVRKEVVEVPKGMFDAIKRLRLSRVEILKCMNSHTSLSCLNGFFTRVRVGKFEAGQGVTGYYVASMTGEQTELSAKDLKKYISVDVGGNQSLVGIQYVSNHDFSQDELVSWWGRTLETGEKVPTQEELKSKFEERMKFGFC